MVVERATDGVAATGLAGWPAARARGARPLGRRPSSASTSATTRLRVAVADLSYAVLAEELVELEVDTAAQDALDTAARAGLGAARRGRASTAAASLAAGMGLPGPIDRESGLVHSQPILPGWVGLDPAAEMEERLGLPVHLDNDANVGALGESTFGAGRGDRT